MELMGNFISIGGGDRMLMDRVFQDSLNSPEFRSVLPAYCNKDYKDVTYGMGGNLEADPQKMSYFKIFFFGCG